MRAVHVYYLCLLLNINFVEYWQKKFHGHVLAGWQSVTWKIFRGSWGAHTNHHSKESRQNPVYASNRLLSRTVRTTVKWATLYVPAKRCHISKDWTAEMRRRWSKVYGCLKYIHTCSASSHHNEKGLSRFIFFCLSWISHNNYVLVGCSPFKSL